MAIVLYLNRNFDTSLPLRGPLSNFFFFVFLAGFFTPPPLVLNANLLALRTMTTDDLTVLALDSFLAIYSFYTFSWPLLPSPRFDDGGFSEESLALCVDGEKARRSVHFIPFNAPSRRRRYIRHIKSSRTSVIYVILLTPHHASSHVSHRTPLRYAIVLDITAISLYIYALYHALAAISQPDVI